MVSSPPLHIRLLGELDLRLGGVPLPPLESARAGSLLAYLVLHREAPQLRSHLAFLLWPDSTEAQARTNLRHLLHTLRRALPHADRFLDVTPRALQWRADAPCWLDVVAFTEAIVRAGREPPDAALAALREAVELYGGELLRGSYDEWIVREREAFRQRYLGALVRLAALLEARHDYAEAIAFAERLLREDPVDEETYRLLMRLHDACGNRARALRVYHLCAATLERELGVEPSAATRTAYEGLLPVERVPPVAERQADRIAGPPLVGRVAEWMRLRELWRVAAGGRAHLVLLTGEPGIGKTRLVEEFRAWCAHRGAVIAEARSYAAEGALAYGPIVAWLRSDAIAARIARLDRARVGHLARLLPEWQPAALDLDIPGPRSKREQRLQLFDAVAQAILAAGSPLLLIAEDLHWADQETLQFIHYLLRAEPNARLQLVATVRREEIDSGHPLNDLLVGLQRIDRLTEIPIRRLTNEETALLAERVVGRQFAGPEAALLYGETEGNPLFVVEALRAGWRGESGDRPWLTAKVQAVIESRLAQLSEPARTLVDAAAAIGREFTPEALAAAAGSSEELLVPGLDELWRRRILRERDAHAYDFSHDKIREVAYLALSPARRQRHHAAIAEGLERLHAADAEGISGQVATHWERAGRLDLAITWYRRAAEAAQKRHASTDAARFLDRALDLLRALPETTERASLELAILAALPAALWVEGYGSQRLAEAHRRALQLSGALGVELVPPLLRSLAVASLTRSDFAGAQRYGGKLWEQGERAGDEVLLVEAAYVLGIAAFWQGELAAARGHFETAVERYRPGDRHAHLLQYGLDPKVICLSRLGNTLWFLGYPGAAAHARDAALAFADEIGHPYSRETALVFAAMLAVEMRELGRLREYREMLETQFGPYRTRQSRIGTDAVGGYLATLDGEPAGIVAIQRALDDMRGAEHAPGIRAYITRLLLEACEVAGEVRIGLAAADEALAENRAPLWEAEIRRLRAEYLAALGAPWQEVEAELDRAIEIACRQGARPFAMRATARMLILRRDRGDHSGARAAQEALRVILDQMPEESESEEIREAKLLLR